MNDVYFKASLQNTLNPEVGTFNNEGNKEGVFTLEDGEYYLTNNTSTSYRVYYPTETINSVGFTIEFDVKYLHKYNFNWILLFNGNVNEHWHGFGIVEYTLQYRGSGLSDYTLIGETGRNKWLHIKCIFDYDHNQNYVDIYIDNVKVNNFTISKDYDIKYIDILGNNVGFVSEAKIKNIIIYSNKHYLDTTGLTSLWLKIKSLFATKTELNSKANDSDVAHKSGDETIAGTKTFSSNIVGNITGNVTGNCSGSSGSCTGNASTATTATKLATARTIALSGAVTGTATAFDGSGNITIPVTALAAPSIRVQWYAAYPNGAEAHNAMWGGRDITAAFNNGTVSRRITDGTFRDIFPGDYITKQVTIPRVLADDGTTELFAGGTYTVNWVVTDCDYWINKGDDSAMAAHHVAIVPQAPIFNARMNSTNTTEGGYAGSEMYKKIIPACATGIVNAFGSEHILTFRDGITNSVDTSHVSSGIPQWTGTPGWWGEWVSVQCNLMSEKMVYGAPICSAGAMDNSIATRQMSAFRLSEKLINYNRSTWWLRDVVSSMGFARVNGVGYAATSNAPTVRGVRPFALLK